MPVDLPPEVIEEAQRAVDEFERNQPFGFRVYPKHAAVIGARSVAAYVRAETLKEVHDVVAETMTRRKIKPFDGISVLNAIDRLAQEDA